MIGNILINGLLVIGTIKLVIFLIDLASFISRQFLRSKPDHLKKYGGKGTWALITGATDGIGLEFCKQLARDGFNICLVSRTESKMQKVVDEDLKEYGVKTKTVIADFTGKHNMDFYDNICSQVRDLDIGFLVINAGVFKPQIFEETSKTVLQELLDVNVYHVVGMLEKFKKGILERKEPTGILVTSSITAECPGLPL